MSLVGTRPPTVDEWEKYELHHRSRMSTKPGITGMWQVSGRSDITDFEEVVRLDTEYIQKSNMKILWGGVFARRTRIKNNGKNNCLILEEGCRIYDSQIQFFGENNTVKIEHDCVLKNVDIWISDGGILEVGHNTHFSGKTHIACIEGKKVHMRYDLL